MGLIAIDQQNDDQDLELDDTQNSITPDSSTGDVDEGAESDDEATEVRIVDSADDGSQPDKKALNKGFRERLRKVTNKSRGFEQQAAEATENLRIANDTNRVLQAQITQQRQPEAPKEPNADDYDDGVHDPKYMKAREDALVKRVEAVALNRAPAELVPAHDYDLERSQDQYDGNVEKLGVKNFAELEAKTIDVLGIDTVKLLIKSNEAAPIIVANLGSNPKKLQHYADLLKSDPVKGITELTLLGTRLSVDTKSNVNQAPDPDMELEGAAPANSNYERQLDKLRGEVAAGKRTMKDIASFKRKHADRLAKV